MKGYLKQIINADGELIGLYHTYHEVDDDVVRDAFIEYGNSDDSPEIGFDEWWNKTHAFEEEMERVYVDEIII